MVTWNKKQKGPASSYLGGGSASAAWSPYAAGLQAQPTEKSQVSSSLGNIAKGVVQGAVSVATDALTSAAPKEEAPPAAPAATKAGTTSSEKQTTGMATQQEEAVKDALLGMSTTQRIGVMQQLMPSEVAAERASIAYEPVREQSRQTPKRSRRL